MNIVFTFLIGLFLLLMGTGFAFFPFQLAGFFYFVLKYLCLPFDEECYKTLQERYKQIKDNPKEFGEANWITIIVWRIIGFIILLFLLFFIKSMIERF